MTAGVMFYGVVVGLLLVPAALLADRAAALRPSPRRWGWVSVLFLTVALPLFAPWRAGSDTALEIGAASDVTVGGVSSSSTVVTSGVGRGLSALAAARNAVEPWAATAWLASSTAAAAVYGVGYVVLARRRRQWTAAIVQGWPVLIAADSGPAVVGVTSPAVVLPEWAARLDASSLAMILRHEHEHVSARDPWLVHGAGLATMLMPWNPAVWWMAARLRLAVEFDCDARVLASRGGAPDEVARYGELLLSVAATQTATIPFAAPALMESSSSLAKRIAAMCAAPGRWRRTRMLSAVLGALVLLVAACGAPVPPGPGQPAEGSGPRGAEAPTNAPVVGEADQQARSAGTTGPESAGTTTFGSGRGGAPRATVTVPGGSAFDSPDVRRLGSGVASPRVLRGVRPSYTSAAMRAKVQGNVELEVVVGIDGLVKDARVTKSLDKEFGLDDEAIAAAYKWQFVPAMAEGKPVPVAVTIELSFTIH